MSQFILQLSDVNATLENVGGKGASLAKLSKAGLPVPNGFHITTQAYRRFVSDNGLQPRILAALNGVEVMQPASLESVASQISELFAGAQIPAETAEAIRAAYAELRDAYVAVRSSATAEDLPGMSFAGQQDTYLNIRGEATVLDAIKRCWASLWSARAIGYRIKNGIDQSSVALAVIVQELVPAEAAGVMFTANPMNGKRDEIVINAAWGLGEAIVSGAVTPDTARVDKSTGNLRERTVSVKQVMTVRTETGTCERPVPDSKKNIPVLNDKQVTELARLGSQIEALYKMPMDIEWAYDGGKFSILQARPITALPEPQYEPSMEWKLPDPKAMYMRLSLIEQLPEPLTPLFSTMAAPIIETATRRLFATMTGGAELKPELKLFETINDYGYMTANFGRWNTLRMAVGQLVRIRWVFSQSESRFRQAHDHYLSVIKSWEAKSPEDYEAVELLEGVRALLTETINMYTVLQIGPIATALGSETMFTQIYNRLIKKKGDPEASVFLMGFESMPIQAEKSLYDLTQWARSQDELAAHLTATPAAQLATEMEGADPPGGSDISLWGEWRNRFREHLAKYGHFTYDLDFAKAVAADDPAPLLETCRMYLLDKAPNPHARVEALSAQREQATQTMLKRRHGPLRSLFRSQLQSAQKFAPLREDGISDLGLGYPLLRKMLREFGCRLAKAGALEQPEDIFWLNDKEAEEAACALDQSRSPASRKAIVQERQRIWKSEQRVSPPMVLPVGSKYMGMDIEKLTSGGSSTDEHVIKGFGSSQGQVTAPARVLLGPQDFDQMRSGDVLVAPLTSPAWTPLFALASAIVTDVGGPLSHSSIVAREYGIPAVLGTGVATRRIHSGQTITVDGSAGTVILAEQKAFE